MNTTAAARAVPQVQSVFPTPVDPRLAELWAEFTTNDLLWQSRARAVAVPAAFAVGEPEATVDVLARCGSAAAMLAWIEYREIGAMHSGLVATGRPEASARGVRMLDLETQAAARIAMSRGISQSQGDRWLAEAIAMRDRIPFIGLCLRDGIISPRQFRLAVSRTELIDGQDWSKTIDLDVAARLRSRTGTWSNKRLIDLIDRIIFRHDPDAVRRRHEKAKASRSVWVLPDADGMATLGATMTAQDANIALRNVFLLAGKVCKKDPRSESARRCDALFSLLSGLRFECDCGTDDCASDIPEPGALAQWIADHRDQEVAKGRVLVHVIADRTTVDGHDDEPAFMDGHGVISAAHLRDLLTRDDVRLRPLNPADSNDLDETSLPTHLPSDPYRPSTALATFVRTRDGYCTIPGCDKPAWQCDIDHVAEYDHDDPPPAVKPPPTDWPPSAACTTTSKHSAAAGSTTNTATAPAAYSPRSSPPKEFDSQGPRKPIPRYSPASTPSHGTPRISLKPLRGHSITTSHEIADPKAAPKPSTPADEPNARPIANNASPRRKSPPTVKPDADANTPAKPTATRPTDEGGGETRR